MDYLFFVIFFFLFLIPLVLLFVIPTFRNHKRATAGIINYDSYMRKFVYRVNITKEEIIRSLTQENAADELSCTVDIEKSEAIFLEYTSKTEIKYHFQIIEYSGFCIVRLEQSSLFTMESYIPYRMNPHMTNKLNAEIIPFSEYGF